MLNFIDLIKAIFLGVIEGLTEFIPVSSTAHLLVSSYLIDFSAIQNNLFEIVIQFGAILAICVVYRQKLISTLLNFKGKSQQSFVLNISLAFLPAMVLGALLHGYIKEYLFSNIVIAIALIVGGIIMIIVDRDDKKENKIAEIEDIKPLSALYIGMFQCLAMVPGVSRSGATIIGGLTLGLNRKVATEFSFFLAIPTIAAASLYDLLQNYASLTSENIGLIIAGMLSAFISSILVIKWLIGFVSKNNFVPFAIYRIIAGILILIFIV